MRGSTAIPRNRSTFQADFRTNHDTGTPPLDLPVGKDRMASGYSVALRSRGYRISARMKPAMRNA